MEIGSKQIEIKAGVSTNIYFIGDVHEGNCNCNHSALREAVKIVENDPNGYWFGMGDYIEAITYLGDKRFDPLSIAQEYSIRDLKDLPMRQSQEVFSYFKPIQDKCLGLVCGNHEEAFIRHNSADVYDRFVNMFKTSAYKEGEHPIKLGYVGFYNLIFGRKSSNETTTVCIALNHGVGGGGYLEGYPINKVHQVFKYMHGDINVMGHIHRLGKSQKNIVTCSARGILKRKPRLWGISGCFLNAYVEGNTNYFESRAGVGGESDIGMLKCSIDVHQLHGKGMTWTGRMEEIYL